MAETGPGPQSANRSEPARIAHEQFERAQQVIATGNLDYAIRLLRSCCDLEPARLVYRQTLRRTVRSRYRNNQRGSWLAWLWNIPTRWGLKRALRRGEYRLAIAAAEQVLARNPWDVGAQVDLAVATEHLGWLDVAAWSLEQARSRQPKNLTLIRQLAHLYEKQENFEQASALWQLVLKLDPDNTEAASQLHHLAASETIQRGRYQETIASGEGLRSQAQDGEVHLEAGAEAVEDHPRAREAATLRQKIAREPQKREHHLRLAALYRAMGDLKTARIVLERGLEATGQAFELRAEMLDIDIEPYREMLTQTEAALEKEPDNADLARQRARLRKEINNRELALYQKWAQYSPQDLSQRYELGVRLLRAGRIDDAIHELQLSRDDVRHRWRSLLYLGHCFRARNNQPLAIRNFEAALTQMPPGETTGRKEALYSLATLHADAGDLARAIEYGTELANIDFGFRDIAALLDTWQAAASREAPERRS